MHNQLSRSFWRMDVLHRNETRSQKRGPGPTKTEASTRKMEKPVDERKAPATEGNPAHNGAKG